MTSSAQGLPRYRTGLAAEDLLDHLQIIRGLAKRELQSRFGQNAFGYSWSFVGPFIWIAATYFAFKIFGKTSPVYTDLITFIISGLIPFAGFRYVMGAVYRSNGLVRPLLIFPSVKLEHGVITLAVMESINLLLVFCVVAGLNLIIFGNGELDNLPLFLLGISLAFGLGVGYGYLFLNLGLINKTIEFIGPILLRPAFFLSGVFFTANELPDYLLEIFAYNPILHAVEISRDGMLFNYTSRVSSAPYVMLWIFALFAAAFVARLVAHRR